MLTPRALDKSLQEMAADRSEHDLFLGERKPLSVVSCKGRTLSASEIFWITGTPLAAVPGLARALLALERDLPLRAPDSCASCSDSKLPSRRTMLLFDSRGEKEMDTGTPDRITTIDYAGLGDRLKAYRIGASLLAEEVAEQLGVSRAVVYRMEKGEIVKIETLERLAQLLNTSLASLLGVEVEYYSNALGFFERMRQLEQTSDRILSHFEPISLLLTSDEYLSHLREMLLEASPNATNQKGIDEMLTILADRRRYFEQRQPNILSLIGLRELERFVMTGLVGRVDLPSGVRKARIKAAENEVRRIADLMESEPLHVQIGLVDDAMPSATFQLFSSAQRTVVAVSPFRMGELPNTRNGIATVTASREAVRLHEEMVGRLWKIAYKGKEGAKRLRELLKRNDLMKEKRR